ncbi:MAG: hypothetical protein NVV63_04775 [Opitutus sp.]|nr:hypothetical protein [Opitutus sp.]
MNSPYSSDPSSPPPTSLTGLPSAATRTNITAENLRGTDATPPPHPPLVGSGPGYSGEPKKLLPSSTLMGDVVGSVLDRMARWLNPGFVERSLKFCRDTGHYAVLLGGALTLVYTIFAAVRFNSFGVFLLGLGLIAALAVGQFAAARFFGAAERTIVNTPSHASATGFLECVGLLTLLAAAAFLLGGLISAIQLGSIIALLPPLFFAVTLTYAGALALHPTLLNVTPGTGSAGEEAIGVLSFFAKASLKLVPLFFLLLAVAGNIAILASFFPRGEALAGAMSALAPGLPVGMALPSGLTGSVLVLLACLTPIVAYALFLLQYLVIDVLRAVLAVPGKLDALRH